MCCGSAGNALRPSWVRSWLLVCAVGGAARQDAGLSLVNHMYSFHAWRNVTMTPTMAMATMTQSVPGINARPAGEQSGLHRQGN